MRSEVRRAALAFVTALLAACGGGGGPPDQSHPPPTDLNGYATLDGRTLQAFAITAKGAVGPARTNGFSGNPSQSYSLSTLDLTAPYMLSTEYAGAVSVATAKGRANVTQLTTLLTIALFGQPVADAFNDYGDASPAQIALINDAEIRRAQADATDFLQNTVQVPVRSGTASFITTEFEPVAGDPMWDTLVALNARIAELGPDAYGAMVADFLQRQHQCRQAQLQIAIGGATTRFCPATTASTTDASDAGVLDHVYTQGSGETLTLRVRGDAVLDATYVDAGGASYACSGSGCAGITLGAAAFDTTRSVTLTSVALTGAGGTAAATGHLSTTVPNVSLADLPCVVGYVHKIREDGSVDSSCYDNSNTLYVLSASGTLGVQEGASTYADYLANGVNIVLNGGELVSITANVSSADGSSSVTAECRGAACQGVTIGAPTVNMGFIRNSELQTRAVTLDGTVLRTVAADGSLMTDTPVRLKASLRLIYYSNVDFNYATPGDMQSCSGSSIVAQVVPDDTPLWTYLVCSGADGPATIYTTPLDGGGLQISFNGQLTINTDPDGAVVYARLIAYHGQNYIGESFGCDGVEGCSGVQLSAADANGTQHVSIAGVVFHNVVFDGFASGPRTGRVDASFDVVPSE